MENIEDKLKNYRVRKRRQERIQCFKEGIKRFLMQGTKDKTENKQPDNTAVTIHESEAEEYLENSIFDVDVVVYSNASSEEEVQKISSMDSDTRIFQYITRIVYFALWMTLYFIAIELQFGIVFLMVSALVGIYLNTRTGPRKRDEVSAYSVFNKNCESIDGTLKAEQFEREIGIR